MSTVIKVENISKQYRLGMVGSSTISDDLTRWWAGFRGKEDPFAKIGDTNDRTKIGNSEYVWALKDINFEVKQGEVLGIIGKNGAGKSTLLKILSKVTAPTTGIIKTKGRIASLLEVGTGFHPELSGRENIFLNGAVLGMKKAEIASKFDEIVAFSGVEKYIDTPVKRYSSGMYVRLAFAVAAHLEPEILIIDEVLAVGDAEFQKKCLGKMKDVSEQGRTVLFVSHNMAAIKNLCPKSLLLKNGEIHSYDETNLIIKNYLTNSSEISGMDLNSREEREGIGPIKFDKVEIQDEKENLLSTVLTGEPVYFRVFYKNLNPSKRINSLVFAIAISNELGQQLTDIAHEMDEEDLLQNNENGFFEIKIPKLNIVEGLYTANVFCRVNGEISDWIIDAFSIKIETGDYYRTGKKADKSQNIFLMDYEFSNILTN